MDDFSSSFPPVLVAEAAPFDLAGADPGQVREIVGRYFDADFYGRKYHPAGASGDWLEEFCAQTGATHDPTAWFSTRHYLSIHHDVRQSGVMPFLHFLVHGHGENRWICAAAADTADDSNLEGAEPLERDMRIIQETFDEGFYRSAYPDVDPAADALTDFCLSGWRNGRDPTSSFSTLLYLEHYPDVVESGLNPFVHFQLFGRQEARRAWPSLVQPPPARQKPASGAPGSAPDAAVAMPPDFLALDYQRANGDLAELKEEWQLIEHYRDFGMREQRRFDRMFDPTFYQRLYFPTEPWRSRADLDAHFDSSGRVNYANAHEALLETGFRSSGWLSCFDVRSYIAANALAEEIGNDAQAIVHFVLHGVGALLPVSERLWFDPAFYRAVSPDATAGQTESQLYRHWLEFGWPTGVPPNETEFVRSLGLEMPGLPEGFDFVGYLSRHPELQADRANRYRVFEHYIKVGAEAAFLPFKECAAAASLLRHKGDHQARIGCFAAAHAVYERALILDDSNVKLLQHIADLLFRETKFERALSHYRRIRDLGHGTYWTFLNGGRAALAAGLHGEAVAWGDRGLRRYPRTACFADLTAQGFAGQIDAAIADHVARCRGDGCDGVEFQAAVGAIFTDMMMSERMRFGDVAGERPVARTDAILRVVMLANEDLPQCTHYRVKQKFDQAEFGDFDLRSFARDDGAGFADACVDADIAIFYRVAVDPTTLRCLAICRRLQIPTFYEIDDLIFSHQDFPEPLVAYGGALDEERHFGLRCGTALVAAFMALCDFGIASTAALADMLRGQVCTGRVFVHRNGLTPMQTNVAAGMVQHGKPKARAEVVIFYGSGTLAHAADFSDFLAPALERLMHRHHFVRLCCCGHVAADRLAQAFPGRVETHGFLQDFQSYQGLVGSADINVAVLRRSRFNDCKSEIKWLEAAVGGVPTIASDVDGFRSCLSDGREILLVRSDVEDWYAALNSLVEAPETRHAIGRAATGKALADYAPSVLGRSFGQDLQACLATVATPARARPRILLVNVFSAPQSIGGATRVFDTQVGLLADNYGDEFDVAVCCGNDDAADPYQLESYFLPSGVRVFVINTPLRERMNWIAEDPAIIAPFERVLSRFRPDLVHFHCIQRLTGVVVAAVARKRIPFVVTLHDAWWLADFQFLMDENDRLVQPACWAGAAGERSVSAVESTARQATLLMLLRNAAVIVAVSKSFGKLYGDCGIDNVRVVENGIDMLPSATERRQGSDKIVLGHVGGISYHKGYFLFRRAVIEARLANLEILVVDHAMCEGDVRSERWGLNEVRVIGKIPQDQIQNLYALIDVLVAPSIWPESFGLVTREAACSGTWIIASNRGAIADPVMPGMNGFIVDVCDTKDLIDAMRAISAAPERFKWPAPAVPNLRSSAENTNEYVKIYREILWASDGRHQQMCFDM